MRNTVCWIIVAILALQVSLSGLEISNNNDFELNESDDEVTNFAGRQSSGMNGNSNADSDCNLSNWPNSADGLGGPVWQNGSAVYAANSIVEWPANSGEFYQTEINTSGQESIEENHWLGPCTCSEIGEFGGVIWNSTMNYSPWQIVDHNGYFWIAQDAGTMAGDEPVAGTDLWVLCEGSCASILDIPTPVWENSTLVTQGEVYQYPANSGLYYTIVGVGMSNQTVGAPGVDFDAWGKALDCDCKQIWADTGSSSWDQSIGYVQDSVVEYPAGTNNLYQALQDILAGGNDPAAAPEWELCVTGDQPSSNPCEEFNGYGGMNWDNMTLVSAGEIYQFPAGSGLFYLVSPGIYNQTVGEPGYDLDAWSEKYCECEDIWMTAGSPVWDSNTVYNVGMMVEYPIGTGDIWMALVSQTTTGVAPDQPFADGNQWELCGGEDPSGNPCAGLTVVGVWDSSINVTSGEIYQYPANSGIYYQVNAGGPFWSVSAPDIDMDVWSPIDCPCKETWVANNQPVWDATVEYPGNYVVEWPTGTGNLYIPLEPTGVGIGAEPGVDIHWVLCSGDGPNPGPCEGITSAGTWNSNTIIAVGEIYEYPASSGLYFQVIYAENGTASTAPGEAQDNEFWEPYTCPCKSTWVANGEPVWDNTIAFYPGNYVVEWPANSGALYLSEAGGITGAGEPGIDGHWIPCEGNPGVETDAPVDASEGLPSIGVALTMLGIFSAAGFISRSTKQ